MSQYALTQVLDVANRKRVVPPRFSWKSDSLDISSLSGLPVEVGLTFDSDNRPWVGLHLNEGLDKGARVVVTSPHDTSWTAPQDLGAAWNESRLTGATSPTGAALAWRSAEGAITLARLTRSSWEATSVALPPEWFEDHWGRSGPVVLPNLTYMLTVSQRTQPFGTGFAITWPEGAQQASVTRFQAPEDLAGRLTTESSGAWAAWISDLSKITVAYFKTDTATPPQRGDIVITEYNPAATQWSAPELAVPGVVGAYTVQHVTRDSADVLIFGSKDKRFGQISQVEIVRSSGSTWTSPSIIEDTLLNSVAPPVANDSICVFTGNGGWTYDLQGNLRKFAGSGSRASHAGQWDVTPRRWSTPATIFQPQLNACFSVGGFRLFVIGEGYDDMVAPPTGGTVLGVAGASSNTIGVADVTPVRVRFSTLQFKLPQSPGPITNLRIDKKARASTTVTWDPPQVAPYPNVLYQVRVVAPGSPGKWGRSTSQRKVQVSTPRPGVRYTVQVRAVNLVGESPVRSIRFKS